MDSPTLSDVEPVRARLESLGLDSAGDLLILPRGFLTATSISELAHEASASTVIKLLKQADLDPHIIQPATEVFPVIQENAATWIGPTIFIGSMLVANNPDATSLALNVIANYVTQFFGTSIGRNAKLDVVIETPAGTTKALHYDGPVSGLKDIPRWIRDAFRS